MKRLLGYVTGTLALAAVLMAASHLLAGCSSTQPAAPGQPAATIDTAKIVNTDAGTLAAISCRLLPKADQEAARQCLPGIVNASTAAAAYARAQGLAGQCAAAGFLWSTLHSVLDVNLAALAPNAEQWTALATGAIQPAAQACLLAVGVAA